MIKNNALVRILHQQDSIAKLWLW